MRPLFLSLLLWTAFVPARSLSADEVPRPELQLARVRAHMSDLLERLPNYTCLLNIERSGRAASGRTQLIDLVRVEVALVNGSELFAWPGSKRFEDTKIVDMVKGGAIGSGNFALHAKSVFQSSAPRFSFFGEVTMDDGRQALKWDYVVPLPVSGYKLRAKPYEAVVGYHGSFWADAATMDIIRLEVYADDIPKQLRITSAADAIVYQRVKLGEEEFLLPSRSELRMEGADGQLNSNRTTFTGCRKYTGESTISFADSGDEPEQATERTLDVPAGLTLRASLETPVVSGVAAVGDPITAILKKDVKLGSGLVAPKGAFLHGRIVALRRQDLRPAVWVVGFSVFELEWEGTRASLSAELVSSPAALGVLTGSGPIRLSASEITSEPGTFFVPGDRLKIPRGFPMEWRTLAPQAEDKR